MNRNLKWNAINGSKRPRRQCYQLLPDDEGEGNNNITDGSIEENINLGNLRSDDYIEKLLDPGETLLTLSLKFNCPVAELKRINHILRDNEIFARRKIKVPIKPGSFVSERLASVHVSNGTSKSDETIIPDNNRPLNPTFSAIGNISLDTVSACNLQVNHEEYPRVSPSLQKENIYLEVNCSSIETENKDLNVNKISSSKCSGADWGMSWLQLVICALLLGFAGPLIYIFFMTERKH